MTPRHPGILLAASGSAASRQATVVAADLASTFNAQLAILHVTAPLEYRVGRLAPTLPMTRWLEDPLTSPVLLDARRVAWTHGASAKTVLIAGDPAPVIAAVASELGADLLVIGSTRRLLPNARAARTRKWIQTHVACPVLSVNANPPTAAPSTTEPVLAV